MATVIQLSKELLNKNDLSIFIQYIDWNKKFKQYFLKKAGEEMYKLLAYLACKVQNKTIIDIGTLNGYSALALASDDDKTVITYDVQDVFPEDNMTVKNKCNVDFRCMDCLEDINQEMIDSTDLICIDIDHKGYYERAILSLLERLNYKGLVVLDNIAISQDMKSLWEGIKQTKYVVTPFGHWTGTGIVVFDESKYKIEF